MEKIIVGLNSAGFSENEYRAVNEVEEIPEEKNSVEPLQLENLSTDEKNISEEKISDEKNSIEEEFKKADELGKEYEKNFEHANKNTRAIEEQNKMSEFVMRERFRGEKLFCRNFFTGFCRNFFTRAKAICLKLILMSKFPKKCFAKIFLSRIKTRKLILKI